MIMLDLRKNVNGAFQDAVIGFYYPNGIFFESDDESGTSYVLDHMIFEYLQISIADKGYGCVSGHTYYGYSSFTVQCKAGDVGRNLDTIQRALFQEPLYYENTLAWVKYRRSLAKRNPVPLDQQYYAARLAQGPLTRTLSQSIRIVPSLENAQHWRRRFIRPEQVVCFITGRNMDLERIKSLDHLSKNWLPRFEGKRSSLPSHMPWVCSNLICSFPFIPTSDNLLLSEVCCEILKKRISPIARKAGGRMSSVQVCPDFISEIRIQLQSFRGTATTLAKEIFYLLGDLQPITQSECERASLTVRRSYISLYNDPLQWNHFLGYNSLSGSRYDVLRLICDEIPATAESVECILMMLQDQKSANAFASASY